MNSAERLQEGKDPEDHPKETQKQKKHHSQYDQVKIKVTLQDHFYVFSRFLMSRILTLLKVNEKDAIKITLDIKKELVEQGLTSVSQQELE